MEMEGVHLFSPPTPRLHHQYPWCALILWGREDGFGRAAPHRPLSTCYAAFVIGILCFISMTKLAPHPATPNHTLPYELLSAILWSPRAESLHSPHHPPSRPPSNWPYEWPGRMLQSLCLLDNDLKLKSEVSIQVAETWPHLEWECVILRSLSSPPVDRKFLIHLT